MPEVTRLSNNAVAIKRIIEIDGVSDDTDRHPTVYQIVCDPNTYTVEAEILSLEMIDRETDLQTQAAAAREAKDYHIYALKRAEIQRGWAEATSRILLPANPEWTEEVCARRLSTDAMASLVSFYELKGWRWQAPIAPPTMPSLRSAPASSSTPTTPGRSRPKRSRPVAVARAS